MGRRLLAAAVTSVLLAATTFAHAGGIDAPWAGSLPTKPHVRKSVSAFPDGTAFFFQSNEGDGLQAFRSKDFGLTWSPLPPLPVRGLTRVAFLSPELGFATISGGWDTLWKSTDGGESWKEIPAPWSGLGNVQQVQAAADGRTLVIAASPWRDSNGGPWGDGKGDECHDPRLDRLKIFTSRDAGKSWNARTVYSSAPVFVARINFLDQRHGLISISEDIDYKSNGGCSYTDEVATGKRVLITHNGGRSFRQVYEPPSDNSVLALALPSPQHVVVGMLGGEIHTSFDGGRTFVEARLDGLAEVPGVRDHYRWIYDIDFASPKVGYALTNGRGLWRTTDGGMTWVREPSPLDIPGFQAPDAGRISAADDDHAVAVGPTLVISRLP